MTVISDSVKLADEGYNKILRLMIESWIDFEGCKTFEEICELGAKFVNDEIDISLGWEKHYEKPNLYELIGEDSWIRPIIHQYNKLGFYTTISQPGGEGPFKPYKSFYDQIHKTGEMLNDGNTYCIKQRAAISGFLNYKTAMEIYNALKDDPYLVIARSDTNGYNDEYRFMTSSFKNDNEYRIFPKEIADLNQAPAGTETHFGIHPFELHHKKYLKNLNQDYYDSKSSKYIIGIAIMDKRWSKNDYLWNRVLELLHTHKV